MEMDPSMEIRKLSPSIIKDLAQILDYADSWKRLMAIIPKTLEKNNYIADVKLDNLPKYNSEHFKIIEDGSVKYKRSCTAILFDEWGTSGKVRPALGHLKYLVTKAQLFRAADYVAVELLNEEPPPRPSSGPAALISTCLPDHPSLETPDLDDIEKQLDKINYPYIAIAKIRKTSQEIKNPKNVIPDIVVSEIDSGQIPSFNRPVIVQKVQPKEVPYNVSDLMKFSHENITPDQTNVFSSIEHEIVPQISILLNSSLTLDSNSQIDASSTEESISSQDLTPAFSKILSSSQNSQVHSSSDCPYKNQVESEIIPALSVLNPGISSTQNESISVSEIIPNFDMLQSKSSNLGLPTPNTISISDSNDSSNSSTKCSSPLPNLYLNTQLPHFTYSQLLTATNNFSDVPYVSEKEDGRFLGLGAFGSVFLASGLLDKPVAVKKMFLDNVTIVNEDDEITKQFRNEVELLSKYKHENLVSLLGYSCDGSTYCLVYEYVSGGALKDKLNGTQKLLWKERLQIALGTAKAVSYLHTAFSTSLIHRDVKSANILLDESNNPKLCDFGLIKLLPSQKTHTHTTAYGTSAYMSPEAHRGDISVKLDTFSFGVVLLELLTSLSPLDYNRQGCDIVTHIEDNCEVDIEPLLDKNVGTWEENGINFGQKLYEIAQKCLEEKKKRPVMEDVTGLIEDLIKQSVPN